MKDIKLAMYAIVMACAGASLGVNVIIATTILIDGSHIYAEPNLPLLYAETIWVIFSAIVYPFMIIDILNDVITNDKQEERISERL